MNRAKEILELCDKVQGDLKLAGLPIDGGATDGTFYSTIHAMWTAELDLCRPSSSSVSVIVSLLCYKARCRRNRCWMPFCATEPILVGLCKRSIREPRSRQAEAQQGQISVGTEPYDVRG